MTPQGPAHALVIQNLTRLVAQGLAADLALRPQLPLTLPDDSEPEPDLVVVIGRRLSSPPRARWLPRACRA